MKYNKYKAEWFKKKKEIKYFLSISLHNIALHRTHMACNDRKKASHDEGDEEKVEREYGSSSEDDGNWSLPLY